MRARAGVRRLLARRVRDDDGSISIFVVIVLVALLLVVGLVVDGGTQLRGLQQADAVAAEAARQAGQEIQAPNSIRGAVPVADAAAAVAAGQAYLAAAGYGGTVEVVDGGTGIQVTATTTRPTFFLVIMGMTELQIAGHAEVHLVRGLQGPT